jgi:hypothetical protein
MYVGRTKSHNIYIYTLIIFEAYNKFEEVMVNTINEHVPMKKRKSISQPAPFMNKTLRSAV